MRALGLALVTGVLWVGVWALLISPRPAPAGDARHYLAMVASGPAGVPAPFAHRVGAPFLAARLPLEPADALRAVTLTSLVLLVAVWWLAGRGLGISPRGLALGGLAVASTQGWVELFRTPWLTDAPGLLFLTVAAAPWLLGRALPLGVVAMVLGVTVRETVLVAALPFVREDRWARVAVVGGGVVFLVLQLAIDAAEGPGLLHALRTKGPLAMLGDSVAAYHAWWLAIPVAARSATLELRALLWTCLAAGALLSVVAVNTVRMLSLALPFVGLALARLSDRWARPSPAMLGVLAAAAVFGAVTWSASMKVLQWVGPAVTAGCLFRLRREVA